MPFLGGETEASPRKEFLYCLLVPAQALVARWLSSFQDFPPPQEPASFGIDQVIE